MLQNMSRIKIKWERVLIQLFGLKGKIIIILFVLIMISPFSYSQTDGNVDSTVTESSIHPLKISGSINAYGELYSISGIAARRPSSTGRLLIRPTFTLFNTISIPVEIILSTEGSSARQNINQFGINPVWGWGGAHLGDFSENYSEFTLNGLTIRGAGIDLHPGIFRFSTVAGFTQQAVNGGAQNGSYKRFLIASKIGLGKDNDSHFDLIFLKSKDDISSINNNQKSITVLTPNGDDQLPIGTIQTIRWSSSGLTGDVKIELSRDGGATFQAISNNQPSSGFMDWNVTGPGTFQAIIKITSNNDSTISDVSDYPFTIASGVPAKIGNRYNGNLNQNAFTPQENLVIGTAGKLNLADNRLVFDFEASGSIYTRDLRSAELSLDSTNIPGIFSSLYKPRTSSNYDYAFNTGISLNLTQFNFKLGYKQIGPGYNSLGLSYLQNDQRIITALTSYRFSRNSITLNWNRFSDNLIDQKSFTTSRNQFGLNLNSALTSKWNANLMLSILSMGNDSGNDTTKVDFSSFVISTNQVFMISPQSLLQNVSFNYTFQRSSNNSVLLNSTITKVHTVNVGVTLYFSKNLTGSSSVGLVSSTFADTVTNSTKIISLGIQNNALKNKLHSTVSISTSFLENNSVIRTIISSSYSLSQVDNLSLSISYNAFRTSEVNRTNFNEIIAGLNFSHSF